MEWKQAVDAVYSEVKSSKSDNLQYLDSQIILMALTGWLNTTLTAHTDGAGEAFSRRVVFLFNNDYTLTLGTGIRPTIARLSEEITGDLPIPFNGMLTGSWDYSRAVNGWRRSEDLSNEDLEKLLHMLGEETGESPTLILPIESKLEILDEEPWWDEDDDYYPTWIRFLELFNEGNLQKTVDTLDLDTIVCDDTEYMSEFCDYSRFLRLTDKLEEDGWFVNLDSHCAACSHGDREWWEKSNPDKTSAPTFQTNGQNSDISHLPDGTFWAILYDVEEERFLKKLAHDFGLDVGPWQEGEFIEEGELYFGSESS